MISGSVVLTVSPSKLGLSRDMVVAVAVCVAILELEAVELAPKPPVAEADEVAVLSVFVVDSVATTSSSSSWSVVISLDSDEGAPNSKGWPRVMASAGWRFSILPVPMVLTPSEPIISKLTVSESWYSYAVVRSVLRRSERLMTQDPELLTSAETGAAPGIVA